MPLTDLDLIALVDDLESDRVERKSNADDTGRIREAICAFANDLPDHRSPGVVFIGLTDDGQCAGALIDDDLLLRLSQMRDDGAITPFPTMLVERRVLRDCPVAVITVEPSVAPPVRFRGRTWVRVGPRRALASPDDERRLNERRRAGDLPYDIRRVSAATLEDLNLEIFRDELLPSAIAGEVLAENRRSELQQLASLRLITADDSPKPTTLGVLTLCPDPRSWLPGAYVQFLRLDGDSLADPVKDPEVEFRIAPTNVLATLRTST